MKNASHHGVLVSSPRSRGRCERERRSRRVRWNGRGRPEIGDLLGERIPGLSAISSGASAKQDGVRLGVPAWTGLTLDDDAANAAYEALHDKYALPVRDLVYSMRGFYLKNAQLLSTRDDFVPRQYLSWCKDTQDSAPAEMKPGEAREIAIRELESNGHVDVFDEWEEKPIGVASIGQVHRAKLSKKYGGHTVVVKVQAPGIERRFRADIRTCIDFCR